MIKNLITSPIKRVIKSPIGGVVNGGGQPIQRNYTTFDPVSMCYILLSNPIDLDQDFEIEYKVLSSAGLGNSLVVHFGNSANTSGYIGEIKNNTFRARPSLNSIGLPPSQSDRLGLNTVTYKRTGNTFDLYINSELITSVDYTGASSYDAIGIYNLPSTLNYPHDGILADFKVWAGGDRDSGSLVLDMPIDEGDLSGGATVNDKSASGNNGVAYNFVSGDTDVYTQSGLTWTSDSGSFSEEV